MAADLTKKQQKYYELYLKLKSIRCVAEDSNVSFSTVQQALKACELKGYPLKPETTHDHIPLGHIMGKTTRHIDYRGNADGDMLEEWVRSTPGAEVLELLIESISKRVPAYPVTVPAPDRLLVQKDTSLIWPIPDLHIGLVADPKQTLDAEFNLEISRKLTLEAARQMFLKSGKVEHTHLQFMGDSTHADNRKNVTERGGHTLDVSGMYHEIVFGCRDIITSIIEQALMNSSTVSVAINPGNHDPNTAVGMMATIDSHYRNEPRVTVDISPAQFKFFKWGVSFVMQCHGNEAPPQRLATFLMDYVIQHEIRSKELYVFKGHVHNSNKALIVGASDESGVAVETFPTMTAKDGWTAASAYTSRKGARAKLFNKHDGFIEDVSLSNKYLSKYI